MKKAVFIITIIYLLVSFTGCSIINENEQQVEYVSKKDFYLDTVVEIKIYNPTEASEDIIQKAFDRIGQLEQLLSVYLEDSDLHKIKESAGERPVQVSEETFYIIKKSLEYSNITDGLFDITIGPLVDLWSIESSGGHIPSDEELNEVLLKVDYNNIVIDDENLTVMLKNEGMIANLGAIAKGYIADEVKEILIDNGVESAIINLGGNVLLVGGKTDGGDFNIGIQDPNSLTLQ